MSTFVSTTRRTARAFTLTELMISVAVLVGVLLVTSKIFSTTSKVTSGGSAAADVLREAAAIERQLRNDIAQLSPDGFFAIRNVSVPNDFRDPIDNALLLNPNLPPDAVIRADQLVFIANGVQSPRAFSPGGGFGRSAQGSTARVYYGHGFQLGEAGLPVDAGDPLIRTHDPLNRLYPWSSGPVNMVYTQLGGATNVFSWSNAAEPTQVAPVDARKWLLVRQPVVLVDDDRNPPGDESKTRYLYNPLVANTRGILTAKSVFLDDPRIGWSPQVFHGRLDAAATELEEIQRVVQYGTSGRRFWWDNSTDDMRSIIASELIYYPRAERAAPSMHRADQALTNLVIGTACSSIRIDWTYRDGTGAYRDLAGFNLFGVNPGDIMVEQPWFGLNDDNQRRQAGQVETRVAPYANRNHEAEAGYDVAETILPLRTVPNTIERIYQFVPGVTAYEAIFGFNQEDPVDTNGTLEPQDFEVGFTPWPSAIRVTLTLHDAETKLEAGREVQFIIDLPRRSTGVSR